MTLSGARRTRCPISAARATNAHETLIWCAKDEKARCTFAIAMKALNDDLQMRSDWVLPICNGQERAKGRRYGVKAHPQKRSVIYYILSLAKPGDVVLDPFFGTETTGAVAHRLGRRWIGIEREPSYVQVAKQRIASTLPLDKRVQVVPDKRSAPRAVAFGLLVESGMVAPGTMLTDSKRRWQARVCADSSIFHPGNSCRGSIHENRRRAPGRAFVQRLELLACGRAGEAAQPSSTRRALGRPWPSYPLRQPNGSIRISPS